MDPQKKAIETIDRSVAVNAGAGTGKTKVLTERFVYVLENEDPQAFTKKQVHIGLSDGINIEIKSGVKAKDKIRGAEIIEKKEQHKKTT